MATTLRAGRRSTARRLGGYELVTVEACSLGPPTTLTFAGTFKSSLLPTSHLDQVWVLCPDVGAPRQLRVITDGLNISTGVITLESGYGSAAAVSSGAEFHSVMPGSGNSEVSFCVNYGVQLASKHILVPRLLTVDLVSDQLDYILGATYPWLDRQSRLTDVLVPNATGTGMLRIPKDRYEFRERAGASVLHFHRPFKFAHGSFTIQIEALSPADRFINGVESSAGLVSDTDYVNVEEADLSEVALFFCYAALAQSEDGSRSAHYAQMLGPQLELARSVKGYDKENDVACAVAASLTAGRAA